MSGKSGDAASPPPLVPDFKRRKIEFGQSIGARCLVCGVVTDNVEFEYDVGGRVKMFYVHERLTCKTSIGSEEQAHLFHSDYFFPPGRVYSI